MLFPSGASAQAEEPPSDDGGEPAAVERGPVEGPEPAKIFLRLERGNDGTVDVGKKVRVNARIKPFVRRQVIQLRFVRGGNLMKRRNLRVKRIGSRNVGRVSLLSNGIVKPGNYRAAAIHKRTAAQERAYARTRQFHPVYPDLDPGNNNSKVALFKKLMRKQGYYISSGSKYDSATERAVMAFRKVNNMSRSYNASPEIFRMVAGKQGRFKLARPGAGRHVEVDISRQVMVLADNGKAQHTFHVSTGAPATPSDKGTYRFFRRQPGYNSIGMYYSVYYNGGEAIHGYKSVPPYNASHGCIRNPIPNSKFIYDWVRLGMQIFVYA